MINNATEINNKNRFYKRVCYKMYTHIGPIGPMYGGEKKKKFIIFIKMYKQEFHPKTHSSFFLHHSVEKRKLFEEIKFKKKKNTKKKCDINFISWISGGSGVTCNRSFVEFVISPSTPIYILLQFYDFYRSPRLVCVHYTHNENAEWIRYIEF